MLDQETNGLLYKINGGNVFLFDIKSEGDHIVGFLSQIGCTENSGDSPNKIIEFERIFINIDTDGGNNPLTSRFHSKMPHR